MKQITLLLLFLICSCKSYDPKLFPRLNKQDSDIVIDFFKYVHNGKKFDLSKLKRIEEIQRQKYYTKNLIGFGIIRYIPSKNIILYKDKSHPYSLYIKDLSTGEDKVLKSFSEKINTFDINSRLDKILLNVNRGFEVYSFPNFKLLEKVEIPKSVFSYPVFDTDTDKIYYKPNNSSISSFFKSIKEPLFKVNERSIARFSYRILPNKDIYIKFYRYNNGKKDHWYLPEFVNILIYGKGWWEHFLLSNPNKEIKPPSPILTTDKNYKHYLF